MTTTTTARVTRATARTADAAPEGGAGTAAAAAHGAEIFGSLEDPYLEALGVCEALARLGFRDREMRFWARRRDGATGLAVVLRAQGLEHAFDVGTVPQSEVDAAVRWSSATRAISEGLVPAAELERARSRSVVMTERGAVVLATILCEQGFRLPRAGS